MPARVHFERKVKNKKPLNRAQRIMRKNKKDFPKWFWRIREDNNTETITLTWSIPRAKVVVEADGHTSFIALSAVAYGAPGTSIELLEE